MDHPNPSKISLESMVAFAKKDDSNTISFVRKPDRDAAPAIMVVLLDRFALRTLGPFLLEQARKLGDNKPTTILDLRPEDPVEFVFRWMEKEGLLWSYDSRKFGPDLVTVMSFVGDVCDELARELSARGVPTSLS